MTCNLKSKVYEKEINLLKQVEALHKNQEDNKVLEVANNIQLKLSQKKTKIDGLKSKLSEVESLASTLKKVAYFRDNLVTFLCLRKNSKFILIL